MPSLRAVLEPSSGTIKHRQR